MAGFQEKSSSPVRNFACEVQSPFLPTPGENGIGVNFRQGSHQVSPANKSSSPVPFSIFAKNRENGEGGPGLAKIRFETKAFVNLVGCFFLKKANSDAWKVTPSPFSPGVGENGEGVTFLPKIRLEIEALFTIVGCFSLKKANRIAWEGTPSPFSLQVRKWRGGGG